MRAGTRARNLILKARSAHEARASKTSLYPRLGFLKFIFRCMYSLSSEFFRLRIVSRDFTISLSLSAIHLPLPLALCPRLCPRSRRLSLSSRAFSASSGSPGLRFVISRRFPHRPACDNEEIFPDVLPCPGFVECHNIH